MCKDFYKNQEAFDNSDYPVDSPFLFINNKKAIIGKMKNEAAGCPITELVRPRSKMYSYIKYNGSGGENAKGVKKAVLKKIMKHGKTETFSSTHSSGTTT